MLPRRPLSCLLALLGLLAPGAQATWSLVLVDQATGEVGVASATCLGGFDLAAGLPVIVVGKGGAAAQSAIDLGAVNRKKIWEALHAGVPATEIIELAKDGDLQKCARQYGVADVQGLSDAWSGACVLQFKGKRVGTVGTLAYALQGNILTGEPVLAAAEQALLSTVGTLSDRLMAGMEAARAMGGDGRCSCSEAAPTSCGAPPEQGFEKSAHVGFLIVARMGDLDGVCNASQGCANGDYWLRLNVKGQPGDQDPVLTLGEQYERFRQGLQGQPDGLTSTWNWVGSDVPEVAELAIVLRDVDGVPVGQGGFAVTVEHAPESAGLSQRQDVLDHGNGTYTLRVVRGVGVGTDAFVVRFGGPAGVASLFPWPTLEGARPGR